MGLEGQKALWNDLLSSSNPLRFQARQINKLIWIHPPLVESARSQYCMPGQLSHPN